MQTPVKFFCQNCGCPIVADGAAAGESFQCFKCPEMVTIPLPRATVSTALARIDDGLPLAEYPANTNGVIVASGQEALSLSRGATPVELKLPGQLGGLKANVDQKTSNAMATTFLGGLLVVVGAMLFAMFGGKHRA
ncbi:MAG: hypothetical protein LC104_17800 [Bacteroidales bacterium]|nr:hypothetical protein [Bacteroidales bacterium]